MFWLINKVLILKCLTYHGAPANIEIGSYYFHETNLTSSGKG